MLIWLLKFLIHWSPKDLMLTLDETSHSILDSTFCVAFFKSGSEWNEKWIKWEVNMWCHNDQRSFWIEKKWLRGNSYLWLHWNLLDEQEMKLIQFTFYFSGHLSHLWDGFVHDIFPSRRIIHSLPIYSSSHYTLKNSCWCYCCHHHCCHYHHHPEASLISILHTIYPLP